jgi:hypothetical protein
MNFKALHYIVTTNVFAKCIGLHRRWEYNIKMDLQEVGWGGVDWIDMAEDGDRWRALVNAVMNLRVP